MKIETIKELENNIPENMTELKDTLSFEIKFEGIDKLIKFNTTSLYNLEYVKEKLSRKLRGYFINKKLEEDKKNRVEKEELKIQIKNLVGEDIKPKIK